MATESNLKTVITSLNDAFSEKLFAKTQDELEEYWHFKHDPSASPEWNLYQFTSMLELYKSFCRRWEEHHNGHCCVVERVRDKYLMPKIRVFVKDHVPTEQNERTP